MGIRLFGHRREFTGTGPVSQVWDRYESATLTVDTQASCGTVTGQVSDGRFTFPCVGSFAQPTTGDSHGTLPAEPGGSSRTIQYN